MSGHLRVVTHNAFWFQGAPSEEEERTVPRKDILVALAALYRQMEVGLLCLQEVQSARAFDSIRNALSMSGAYCPGGELPAYGGAILWRPDLPVRVIDSQGATPQPQRMWQVAEIGDPEGASWRIANIHLPSDKQLPPESAGPRRLDEIRAMLEAQGPVDLLVGDLNEEPDVNVGRYLDEMGYTRASPPEGVDTTAFSGKRSDHIWLYMDRQPQMVDAGVVDAEWLHLPIAGKEYLSDHLPLWVMLDLGNIGGQTARADTTPLQNVIRGH
jgi:endonuclease/exonuclease/phosphatase family metal-dependent hydrolase